MAGARDLDSSDTACDLCGRELRALDPADRVMYCTPCQRFVCGLCWTPGREICSACLQPGIPTLGYHRPVIADTFEPSTLTSITSRRPAARRPLAVTEQSDPPPRAPGRGSPHATIVAAMLALFITSATAAFIIGAGLPHEAAEVLAPAGGTQSAPRDGVLGATSVPAGSDAAEDGTSRYTVVAGDTLRAIAGQLYGDPNDWRPIYEANREVLDDPNDLAIGMELVIPVAGP